MVRGVVRGGGKLSSRARMEFGEFFLRIDVVCVVGCGICVM